jgi:DNA-binding response OmpR family regulator
MMSTILNIQRDEALMAQMSAVLRGEGHYVIDSIEARTPRAPGVERPTIVVMNTDIALDEKRACIVALRILLPGVGIIDMSAGAEEESYDTGADGYLGKPLQPGQLIARVNELAAA